MPETYTLPRSKPEAEGISSSAILDFLTAAEESIHYLHSMMLLRHGKVVAEGWWYPWRADSPHMLFSLSKSFTATAVGFAIAEGRLKVDDFVLSLFPADAPKKVDVNLEAMQVQHLLSMSTGHHEDTTERIISHPNPVKKFLSLSVEHAPGTYFVYNSGASFVLSAILKKLTGETLLDYLTPRLFKPLGIVGATWESHPSGINFGGWGLNIKTEDIARFGQLYLQKGQWNGRQLLPESWVAVATSKQVSNGDDPNSDWTQGYGYHFWRSRHNSFRGDGAFGQFCIIMPDQDAVLAITAGVPDMQAVLSLVWDKLLPAMRENPLPVAQSDHHRLSSKLENLRINPPNNGVSSSVAQAFSDRSYKFMPNYETLHSLRFDFGKDACDMTYQLLGGGKRRGIHRLVIGYGKWVEGISYLGGLTPQPVAASGVWTAEDAFSITICQYETPFIPTIVCRFEGEKIIYSCKVNLSFGPLEFPQLIGTAEI